MLNQSLATRPFRFRGLDSPVQVIPVLTTPSADFMCYELVCDRYLVLRFPSRPFQRCQPGFRCGAEA